VNCKCGNAARYINERSELCCAICPLGENIDSIRLTDVPALLKWARRVSMDAGISIELNKSSIDNLREIIGKGPARVPVRERTCVVLPTVFAESVEEEARRFAASAPLVITNVEQLLKDETYLPYVPTSADGAIIGEPLAQRLAEAKQRPCATCGKPGHRPMDHAGWDPTQEGHG
jgi:hypothetical protein